MTVHPDKSRIFNATAVWPWLGMLAMVILVGAIRFRLLEMPLERDEGEYAYSGQLILQGIPPYQLACNFKLPGTYYAYALGMAVFGQTASGIHLMMLLVNSLIIFFVFLLGKQLFGIKAGLVSCAAYGVMSVSPSVLGLAGHANFFVILFAIPATLVLWHAMGTRSFVPVFGSGLLYGLAFLMKQQGMFFGLFGLIVVVLAQFQGHADPRGASRGTSRWARAAEVAMTFALGWGLPFGVVCLYLAGVGVFSKFWFWTFTYARTYVSAMPWSYGAEALGSHLDQTWDQSFGLWLMALAGLVVGLRKRAWLKPTMFTMGLWLFSFLATATGLYFRRHYFILLLPAFSLLLAINFAPGGSVETPWRKRLLMQWGPLLLLGGLLFWNVLCQAGILFQLPPEQACRAIYPQNPFVEAPQVARYIQEHSSTNSLIGVVGSEPEIYFYARRHSATSYIYTYDLMLSHPRASQMQSEFEWDIESKAPQFLVFVSYENSWLIQTNSNQGIFDWFDRLVATQYDRVGMVENLPSGEIYSVWGPDAARIGDSAMEHLHLLVYQRKNLDSNSDQQSRQSVQ